MAEPVAAKDYDVAVIGGGINGLTVAAYLAKAGLSVGVFEARGQCGAHCDTVELGIPGYLHNTHAVWLVPSLSPAMADLELERFGVDLRGTDVLYANTLLDGTNVLHGLDPAVTAESMSRASEHDWQTQAKISAYLLEHAADVVEINRRLVFSAADSTLLGRLSDLTEGILRHLGLPISGEDAMHMTALEVLEVLFESEAVLTTRASLSEYTGQWPSQRSTGPQVFGAGEAVAVHTARGGSHVLTHALVKCLVAYGGEVWTTCPVERIIVHDGRAVGIGLSSEAVLPGKEITARVVVSNLTLVPTFLRLLGEEVIGADWAARIRRFNYDDPQLVGVYYALRGDPEFASAGYDPGVQRAWVGYLGGESFDRMRRAFADLAAGIIPDEIMAGWFLPTRADPSQAPPGGHTAMAWVSVPASPRRWRGHRLAGWDSWPELAEPLSEAVTDRFEQHAPGFKSLILERHVMTPMEQERNNPSAIRGNMIGGSAVPEQSWENRPLPGIVTRGSTRTFVPGLYLSNSIHPYGATHLASGYVAAGEIAEDLGCRDAPWWTAQPFDWFIENFGRIPLNLGVDAKWLPAVNQ